MQYSSFCGSWSLYKAGSSPEAWTLSNLPELTCVAGSTENEDPHLLNRIWRNMGNTEKCGIFAQQREPQGPPAPAAWWGAAGRMGGHARPGLQRSQLNVWALTSFAAKLLFPSPSLLQIVIAWLVPLPEYCLSASRLHTRRSSQHSKGASLVHFSLSPQCLAESLAHGHSSIFWVSEFVDHYVLRRLNAVTCKVIGRRLEHDNTRNTSLLPPFFPFFLLLWITHASIRHSTNVPDFSRHVTIG